MSLFQKSIYSVENPYMLISIVYLSLVSFANNTPPSLLVPSDIASTAPSMVSQPQGDYASLVDAWVNSVKEHKEHLEKTTKNTQSIEKYADIVKEGQLLAKKLEEEKNEDPGKRFPATVARWKQYEQVCRKTAPEQTDYIAKVSAYQTSLEASLGKSSSSKEEQRVERTKNYSQMMQAFSKQMQPNAPLLSLLEGLARSAEALHQAAIQIRDTQDPLEKDRLKSSYEAKRSLYKQEHRMYVQKQTEELTKKSALNRKRSSTGILAQGLQDDAHGGGTQSVPSTGSFHSAESHPSIQQFDLGLAASSTPIGKPTPSTATPSGPRAGVSKTLTLGTQSKGASASTQNSFHSAHSTANPGPSGVKAAPSTTSPVQAPTNQHATPLDTAPISATSTTGLAKKSRHILMKPASRLNGLPKGASF